MDRWNGIELAQERGRWYRHVDAALLRASAHTGEVVPVWWPDLDDKSEIEQSCVWLGEVWAQAPVAEAIAVASPVLADRVEAVCAGLRPGTGQVRRMVMSVARYLVRMRGRATPFGAFAGVAPLRFGSQLSVRWTEGHQARTRPTRSGCGGDRPAGVLSRAAAASAGRGQRSRRRAGRSAGGAVAAPRRRPWARHSG